jgi:hypothetical protein
MAELLLPVELELKIENEVLRRDLHYMQRELVGLKDSVGKLMIENSDLLMTRASSPKKTKNANKQQGKVAEADYYKRLASDEEFTGSLLRKLIEAKVLPPGTKRVPCPILRSVTNLQFKSQQKQGI